MFTLMLNFVIPLEGSFIPVFHHGPMFHRWHPSLMYIKFEIIVINSRKLSSRV